MGELRPTRGKMPETEWREALLLPTGTILHEKWRMSNLFVWLSNPAHGQRTVHLENIGLVKAGRVRRL